MLKIWSYIFTHAYTHTHTHIHTHTHAGKLELQGEHAETILKILIAEGFSDSKIAGGIPQKKK